MQINKFVLAATLFLGILLTFGAPRQAEAGCYYYRHYYYRTYTTYPVYGYQSVYYYHPYHRHHRHVVVVIP